MINTFKVHNSKIRLNSVDEGFSIYFFGDVHRFVKSCDVDRWRAFLREAERHIQQQPNTFFFGMGDYDDFASTREKKEMVGLHETTIEAFHEMNEKRTRVMAAEMKVMRGRTLGLIEGNHHWVYQNGMTTTQDLANRLQAEYLGWLCHYTIGVYFGEGVNRTTSLHFVLCHGKAGGKRAGATINQVEDMKHIFPMADVYCFGHDHHRGAWPTSVLYPVNSKGTFKIKQKTQWLCRSGSFKKAYEDNTAGYEIGRLLKPADLGAIRLDFGFTRYSRKGVDMIITNIKAVI